MKRKIYSELLEWKNTKNAKPLMLLGARQVGKTYIIEEFCKEEYEEYVKINLFERDDIVDLYKMRITSREKFLKLKGYLNKDIEKDGTVVFIDEIQESEELIAELKYFYENHPSLRIIVAGSLLGVKLKRTKVPFPVGKITIRTLYPMNFEEFLIALQEEYLLGEIKRHYETNEMMDEALHEKAMNYYRLYMCTGGMPESVLQIVNSACDITKYDKNLLKDITSSYFDDISRYTENNNEALRVEKTYASIPSQLANESKKFQYNKIQKDAKSREFEMSIDWLNTSNLILKSLLVSTPQVPLKAYSDEETFKVYLSDVGLLSSSLELKYSDILSDNISLYKGSMVENYAAIHLVVNGFSLYYWKSSATAEVDFLIYTADGIIPVEVKAGDNTKSKSLNVYIDKYNPKYSIRISSKNFGYVNGIKSIPLYAVFCIK